MKAKMTLAERIARNWKVIKKYEGKKVLGKKGLIKRFDKIRKTLEETLDGNIFVLNKEIYISDRQNPYRVHIAHPLYIIDDEGKLAVHGKTAWIAEDIDSYLLSQREEYEKLIEAFRQFKKQFEKVSEDYFVRQENSSIIISELQKLANMFWNL